MPIVVTIDQRRSRGNHARASSLVFELNRHLTRSSSAEFEVTVGDELQGVLDTPDELVRVVRLACAMGDWWIGIGVGGIDRVAATPRQSTGPAFFDARQAVTRAKKSRWGSAAEPYGRPEVRSLDEALALWVTVLRTRTSKGWAAVRLRYDGLSEPEIATRLAVTQQAVHERLRAAFFPEDEVGASLITRLTAAALA
jgi:hypothetical protein